MADQEINFLIRNPHIDSMIVENKLRGINYIVPIVFKLEHVLEEEFLLLVEKDFSKREND